MNLLDLELFHELILQALILFVFRQFIFAIRDFRKTPWKHITVSLVAIIPLFAVLIFFPVTLGPTVTFDFSSIFLMIVLSFFGNLVSIISFITAIVFTVLKYTNDSWLRLIPYLVGSLLVVLGVFIKRKSSNKVLYTYVFIALLLNSVAIFLTSALVDRTPPILLLSAIILFILAPLFGGFIATVFYHNDKLLNDHEKLVNQAVLQKSLFTSAYKIQIIAVDRNFNYLTFNEHHERLLFKLYKSKPIIGQNFLNNITDAVDRHRLERGLSKALNGEIFELEVEDAGRKKLSFQESYAPIKNQNNEIIGATIFIYELSERVEREKRIEYLSYHDQGTGLYNRRYLDKYVRDLKNYNGEVCVIYSDINGLKITNDLFGHDAGDELLIAVTSKLESEFKNGMIARIGGDEIIIIVRSGEINEIEKKIKRIQKEFKTMVVSHLVVSVSFGVALAKNGSLVFKAHQEAEDKMYRDKLNNVNVQNKEVVDVLLKKFSDDYNLRKPNEEVLDLSLKIGRELYLTETSLNLLKVVVEHQYISWIYTTDLSPYIFSDISVEDSAVIRKRLTILNRLILTTAIYDTVSFDLVAIFENFNGSGQPRGLQGEEIPLKARIIRPVIDYVNLKYRNGMSDKEALEHLQAESGHLYDPLIASALIKVVE